MIQLFKAQVIQQNIVSSIINRIGTDLLFDTVFDKHPM